MHPTDLRPIRDIAKHALGEGVPVTVEPVGDGISTVIYRLRRGEDVFYLRVQPEADASFVPEAFVHALLRRYGLHVPDVIHVEHRNEGLQRSVMITTEIRGEHVGHLPMEEATRIILIEAGRELAVVNSVPVDGFGWICDTDGIARLEAEQPSNRAFLLEDPERYLSALDGHALTTRQVRAVQDLIRHHTAFLNVPHAHLAHGDFDLTHIYQEHGRYTGIIDFGEIRGTGPLYDLGHFRLHDGETAAYEALRYLIAGYRQVAPLPPDGEQQIAFLSLLIGIRFLARDLLGMSAHRLTAHSRSQAGASIKRDLKLLRQAI